MYVVGIFLTVLDSATGTHGYKLDLFEFDSFVIEMVFPCLYVLDSYQATGVAMRVLKDEDC